MVRFYNLYMPHNSPNGSIVYQTITYKILHLGFMVRPYKCCLDEFESGDGRTKRRKDFCRASTFLALQVQLVVLASAFVMGCTTVWSVSCLLFFYSRCPPCPAICKSGGTRPYNILFRFGIHLHIALNFTAPL